MIKQLLTGLALSAGTLAAISPAFAEYPERLSLIHI